MFEHSWAMFEHSWAMFEHSWAMFEHSWAMFEHSWAMFEHSWAMFEHSSNLLKCIFLWRRWNTVLFEWCMLAQIYALLSIFTRRSVLVHG